MTKQTLNGKAKAVVTAYHEFLKDPANKLPMLSQSIQQLETFIKYEENRAKDKNQLTLW